MHKEQQLQGVMSNCLGHYVSISDHFSVGGTRVQLRFSIVLQQGSCCWGLVK